MLEPEREAILYLGLLRRRWVVICVVTLLSGLLAAVAALSMKPRFTAHTQLFFGVTDAQSATNLNQGSVYIQSAVKSYALLATSPRILDPVIRDLSLEDSATELAEHVHAEAPLDTVVVRISVSDASADRSARIANAIAHELEQSASSMSPQTSSGRPLVTATVTSPAIAPSAPSGPHKSLLVALGLVAGLLISVGYVVARDRFSDAMFDEADLPFGPVLTRVPRVGRSRSDNPRVVESYRQLSTLVRPIEPMCHSILVTSTNDSEGSPTTAEEVAAALASCGRRVLLVDANLRGPGDAAAEGKEGFVESLRAGKLCGVVPSSTQGLDLLPAMAQGLKAPDIGRVLNRDSLARLLEGTHRYEDVVFDAPPLLTAAETVEIAQVVSSVVVVATVGRTRRSSLRAAADTLRLVGVTVRGVVLCGVNSSGAQRHCGLEQPEVTRWAAALSDGDASMTTDRAECSDQAVRDRVIDRARNG